MARFVRFAVKRRRLFCWHSLCTNSRGRARETQAGALATQGANALRATPLPETTRGLVWERFRLDYNDPRIRCRQVATIADRFEKVARDIRGKKALAFLFYPAP
jgi:hypothetical protein